MATCPDDAAPTATLVGTTGGRARAVRDRTGDRAVVHGVPANVARTAGVLPNLQTKVVRTLSTT